MAVLARRILRAGKFRVLLDKGYHNAEQLDAGQREGITTYKAHQDAPRSTLSQHPGITVRSYNLRRKLTILGVDGVKEWAKRFIFVKIVIGRFVEHCGGIFSCGHVLMTGRGMEGYRIVGVGYCSNCR